MTDDDIDNSDRSWVDFEPSELLDRVREAKRETLDEHRSDEVAKQHKSDKLTARERIDYLCDQGTFTELGQLAAPDTSTPETAGWCREDAPADGIVTGLGRIDGREVAVVASDFTVKGGSVGMVGLHKIRRLEDQCLERGIPSIMLHDGGGHRIQEGLDSRLDAHAGGGEFARQTTMSGWVPQVSAMMGPGFAAPSVFASQSDFVPMVEGTSTLGMAGPSLVKAAFDMEVSKEELGGAKLNTVDIGQASRMVDDDEACLDIIAEFLSYVPQNAQADVPSEEDYEAPAEADRASLNEIIPANNKKGYDVSTVIEGIVDQDSQFELKPRYARNVVATFGRVEGSTVGIVANDPRFKAGTFDVAACEKMAHFVSFCDAFGIPLIFLTDVPGTLPGTDSEREGIARHSGKVLFEINRATVPKINVVLRRAYGLGYVLMAGGRSTTNDLTVAWPTAEISAMGIEGAVDIIYRKELEAAESPAARREELIEKFKARTGAVRAAEGFGIDEVIEPKATREWIARVIATETVEFEGGPPKKHGINPI
jgi:acetyl-CoA carboxylase carboxyltransferase component